MFCSCSLTIQVMKTGPLPAPSKCKSRRFKAWEHCSNHRTTLWRWWSRSPRLRTLPGRPGPRSSSKRSRQSLMKLPQRPIMQIARDLGVSHTTVNACVKKDLKCRSYRRQTSQTLTEKIKNLRLIKSVRSLKKLKHPKKPNILWFFSDEKDFCQDQVHNSQNHRWIATNNRDVPRVMVFCMVSSEGHIIPPHIFEFGLKVNIKVYLDVLKSMVISWWNQVAGGRPWVWQQDSAPAHKSKEAQAWLQKECYDFMPFSRWPRSSATWTRWTKSLDHTSRTLPTWPPTTLKPVWSPPSTEYSPSSSRRRHAPSSGSVPRRWLRLTAATLNRCQLY